MEGERASPIFHLLNRHGTYSGAGLTITIPQPDDFEALDKRLFQRDPAGGCLDPEVLEQGQRDTAVVKVSALHPAPASSLRLHCYMAHLVSAESLSTVWTRGDSDEEDDTAVRLPDPQQTPEEARIAALYQDGTWAGTLFWDSAVHTCEYLLADPAWAGHVRGATVVELGCGLGLPGFICHAMGAGSVALTDRRDVTDLCAENIRALAPGSRPEGQASAPPPGPIFAYELEWTDTGAAELRAQMGGTIDVLLACDCIFAPLYGDSYPLLNMLEALCSEDTRILLAAERRKNDGIDNFFEYARQKNFITTEVVNLQPPAEKVQQGLLMGSFAYERSTQDFDSAGVHQSGVAIYCMRLVLP